MESLVLFISFQGNCCPCSCVLKSLKTCVSLTQQFMRSILTGLGVILCCAYVWSCSSEKGPEPSNAACDTVMVTSARIYAIIQANCTNQNCHPGGGAPVVADFSTLAKFKSYISSNSANFKLRVTSANADMPQSQGFPPLPQAVRDSIACWVDKGMPD